MVLGGLRVPAFLEAVPIQSIEGPAGSLILPINDEDILAGRVKNVHTVSAFPGSVRGNHEHHRRTESLCVLSGHFLAAFRASGESQVHWLDVPYGTAVRFVLPPGVGHAVKNVGDSVGMLLCYADLPFDASDVTLAGMDFGTAPAAIDTVRR